MWKFGKQKFNFLIISRWYSVHGHYSILSLVYEKKKNYIRILMDLFVKRLLYARERVFLSTQLSQNKHNKRQWQPRNSIFIFFAWNKEPRMNSLYLSKYTRKFITKTLLSKSLLCASVISFFFVLSSSIAKQKQMSASQNVTAKVSIQINIFDDAVNNRKCCESVYWCTMHNETMQLYR